MPAQYGFVEDSGKTHCQRGLIVHVIDIVNDNDMDVVRIGNITNVTQGSQKVHAGLCGTLLTVRFILSLGSTVLCQAHFLDYGE